MRDLTNLDIRYFLCVSSFRYFSALQDASCISQVSSTHVKPGLLIQGHFAQFMTMREKCILAGAIGIHKDNWGNQLEIIKQ